MINSKQSSSRQHSSAQSKFNKPKDAVHIYSPLSQIGKGFAASQWSKIRTSLALTLLSKFLSLYGVVLQILNPCRVDPTFLQQFLQKFDPAVFVRPVRLRKHFTTLISWSTLLCFFMLLLQYEVLHATLRVNWSSGRLRLLYLCSDTNNHILRKAAQNRGFSSAHS